MLTIADVNEDIETMYTRTRTEVRGPWPHCNVAMPVHIHVWLHAAPIQPDSYHFHII